MLPIQRGGVCAVIGLWFSVCVCRWRRIAAWIWRWRSRRRAGESFAAAFLTIDLLMECGRAGPWRGLSVMAQIPAERFRRNPRWPFRIQPFRAT